MANTSVFHQIVEARWAHPAWSHYGISVIHLRDVAGIQPAKKHYADATHELIIAALHPDDNKTPMEPLNLVMQATFGADDDAARLGERVVERIQAKRLNPDTDFLSANAAVCEYLAVKELGATRAETCWLRGERG